MFVFRRIGYFFDEPWPRNVENLEISFLGGIKTEQLDPQERNNRKGKLKIF
jgi:hypothetical protein